MPTPRIVISNALTNTIYVALETHGKGILKVRIDKFLKLSRVIKRRTLANEACESGKVKINGRVVKPSAEVKPGDIIEITFGSKTSKMEVVTIAEHVPKSGAAELIRIIE